MKRVFCKIVLILSVVFLVFPVDCFAAAAKIPSPSRQFYVYDEPGVLSLSTEDHIITENEKLEARCGAQIVVACVKTTGNLDIADYTYKLFNKWEIGSKKEQNGVLILLSVEENDYFALQGRGLENLLSAGTLKLMLDDCLEPHFAAGEYDEGALAIFDAVLAFVSDIYGVGDQPVASTASTTVIFEDFDLDSFIDSAIDNATSLFVNFWPIQLIVGLFSGASKLFKIAAIVILILLLLRLFGGKRGGGGGARFGGSGRR